MANGDVIAIEDSEDEKTQTRPASKQKNGRKAKAASPSEAETGDGEDGDGSEKEYEIEKILDAKRGVYGAGRMSYLVKWKGYGEDQNSWVDEQDAGNADELINEYWRNHESKSPTSGRKRGAPKKSRSSVAQEEKRKASPAAKRGRKSKVEENEDDERPAKKQKQKSMSHEIEASTQPSLNGKAGLAVTPDGADAEAGSMAAYMHMKNWESIVQNVQTVEAGDDGRLKVYFVIRDMKGDDQRVIEDSTVCAQRFPQKLIQFYESHLRWRPVDENPEQP